MKLVAVPMSGGCGASYPIERPSSMLANRPLLSLDPSRILIDGVIRRLKSAHELTLFVKINANNINIKVYIHNYKTYKNYV